MRAILGLVGLSTLFLTGCAGSPVHTRSLPASQLIYVDDYTLCKAFTPREEYQPSQAIINEVERRGVRCSSIYTYTGTQELDAAVQVLQQSAGQQRSQAARAPAFFKTAFQSGTNKICVYDRLGSDEYHTITLTQICSLTLP